MIFVGDIALPYETSLNFVNIPSSILNQDWVVNLEGALVRKDYDRGVYNNIEGFKDVLNQLPIKIACLANNHITDTEPISKTQQLLSDLNIGFLGAGSKNNYNQEMLINDFVVINFAWSVIQAIPVIKDSEGVNSLTVKNVTKEFQRVKSKYPDKKIIVVFHWNYELELYPMPRQRELAKFLVDEGAELIIGHHSHLVQGIESYKGKFIVHGLGNWAFEQKAYYGGLLKFPSTSLRQCAFEYNEIEESANIHLFSYDIEGREVHYDKSISLSNVESFEAEYQGMDEKEYVMYFREKRIKRKLLPIYKWSDSEFSIQLKDSFMKVRDKAISILR